MLFSFLLLCNLYMIIKHVVVTRKAMRQKIDTRASIMVVCASGLVVRIVSVLPDCHFLDQIVTSVLLPRFRSGPGTDGMWFLFPAAQAFWFAGMVLLFLFWGALARASISMTKVDGLILLVKKSSKN